MRATSVFTSTIAVTTETAYRLVHGSPGSGADLRERAYAGRRQPGEQGLQDIGGGPCGRPPPGGRAGPRARETRQPGARSVWDPRVAQHPTGPAPAVRRPGRLARE